MASRKLWGLRSKDFITRVETAVREDDMPKRRVYKAITPFQILTEVVLGLGKFYFVTVLIHFAWNSVLVDKIKDLKALSIPEAFLLMLAINFLTFPVRSVSESISKLLSD